jgi:hypothetical protein
MFSFRDLIHFIHKSRQQHDDNDVACFGFSKEILESFSFWLLAV